MICGAIAAGKGEAEALVERKAAQQKLAELNERLQRVAIVQEGERPVEEPDALLAELDEVTARLERLILAINRTNSHASLADGARSLRRSPISVPLRRYCSR
ncbi:MAG: DIP1984 family protein [Oscillochloridaceae bacterium umkhey_bin13]